MHQALTRAPVVARRRRTADYLATRGGQQELHLFVLGHVRDQRLDIQTAIRGPRLLCHPVVTRPAVRQQQFLRPARSDLPQS